MKTPRYFTEADLQAIKKANSFKELYIIAEAILKKMPERTVGVCDPLSTSHVQDNLVIFNKTIEALLDKGIAVFNEIPFEEKITELKEQWFVENKESDKKHCAPLIEDFFKPLLESKKITKLILLPNWQDKYLSYWEDSYAVRHNIPTVALPLDWTDHYNVEKVPSLGTLQTSN